MAVSTPCGPARSRALDDLIMGTNSSSIVSKRSVERLYYPDEPHFFRYFVNKFQRRAPLINRGYWLRLRAIDVIIRQFLQSPSTRMKVVINLGCGSDVLPWQCHARYAEACEKAIFIDVDYPDLMHKKRAIVLETPELRQLLGVDYSVSQSEQDPLLLSSSRYCQLACDLRQLDALRTSLESFLDLSTCDVLFVAEVSVTYMDTYSADSLVHWASSIGHAQFCLLEQILPHGPDHPFAQTMLRHFNKLKTPPRSVGQYPTVESQRSRFLSRGWQEVIAWDLWDAWSSDYFLSPQERTVLDGIEPFDEWEEFMLFARHYVVLHARASPSLAATPAPRAPLSANPTSTDGVHEEIKVTYKSEPDAPKRRFGNAMVVNKVMGEQFVVHMLGMGSKGRSDTYSVYATGNHEGLPKLPVTGPTTRVCFSITELGDFGVLLAGGRGSPASAMADCWLFRRGAEPCWQPTWTLPKPLFRHSATRIRGSSLALIFGGKTGATQISEECYVFHPESGWLKCDVQGAHPEPTFGAILCSSSHLSASPAVFCGLLAGGMGEDGQIVTRRYLWRLDMRRSKQPVIKFEEISASGCKRDRLSVFGAQTVDLGSRTMICGGMGEDPSIQGQAMSAVTISDSGYTISSLLAPVIPTQHMPFMIGCSIVASGARLIVLGGGATCFSMGTFWESGTYLIEFPADTQTQQLLLEVHETNDRADYVQSSRLVGTREDVEGQQPPAARAIVVSIPRIRLDSDRNFSQVLRNRTPVIMEGMNVGGCVEKWQPDYMIACVGQHREVTVHECQRDTEKMDFNSKNFRYLTDTFESVVRKMEAGGRLYLRSLSNDKPSEVTANIEQDFPSLAADFGLPSELSYVKEHLFSSVLRVSGKVNMWLHYDVMANIYTQVRGSKRMMLFPPRDVGHLCFAPGTSSSSLDVFSALDTAALAGTHPHEALLSPGDVLFLPPMWLHTATPTTDMSVAVNIFFRDLEEGYATGRDVYGNRDLAAYEKGRHDISRIYRGFGGLPSEIRRFYLARIADELQVLGQGG